MRVRFLLTKWVLHFLAKKKRHEFELAIENPREAQKQVLNEILHLSGRTCLPEQPTSYGDYPEKSSWTTESVDFYETTSGNSGKKKAIPYTKKQLSSFQNLFILWVDDVLFSQKLSSGQLFISISPKLESMGMNSDLDYLDPLMRKLLAPFMAVPMNDFVAQNGDDFFSKVSTYLLNNRKLEIISVWSPSYLVSLVGFIYENRNSFGSKIDTNTREKIESKNWRGIWPNLKIISCWTDGSSQLGARRLKQLFPQVVIQGKGLLATEAPISIPWAAASGCIPLWTEVYLEYIDSMGRIKPLYEMSVNQSSEILVSTKGGLLRYRLGDIVECGFRFKGSPVIKFVRRAGEVSDLVGEKLDAKVLFDVFSEFNDIKWILVADTDHYVFVSENEINPQEVEKKLAQIHHYQLARELGQLKMASCIQDTELSKKLNQYFVSKNVKLGDIKSRLLWADSQILNFLKNSRLLDSSL